MSFSNDQLEPNLPVGANSSNRTSVDFLPRYFRTSTNQKFLGATVDQLISEGEVDKVNAYIGRRNAKSSTTKDNYLEDVSSEREAYQLEPSLIIKDSLDNVTFFKDYNDYINQLKFFNGSPDDHSLLNSQEFYSWNPHIDWDKFVNYREYYWLPTGPQVISVAGRSDQIVSTYSVTVVDEVDNYAYLFSADGKEGLTRNPSLTLYRGETYRFEIDCPGHPMAFKTIRDTSDSYIWSNGITSDTLWVENGVIEFKVPENAPNVLYYVSRNDVNSSGIFKIYDISEASEINVETEILGKKTYTTSSSIALSNGMKVNFIGRVTPEKYSTGNWYVEGVGSRIYLISETDLEVPARYTANNDIEFDNENFDSQGFDVNNNFPASKDYITINRASKDRNPWTRYNRWFHVSVIEASAAANNQPVVIDQDSRATRPIIEFNAGLQLINHGREAKKNVNLVDTFTKDVFSTIEGSLGYNVDGVNLVPGMRVLFTADTDIQRVNGRIFQVNTVTHLGIKRLTLTEVDDTEPLDGETVLVLDGEQNRGKMFHYVNGYWSESQSKTSINQPPLFDVFDDTGVSYSDKAYYVGSSFTGTKIFNYRPGSTVDTNLGFKIAYKNISNIGDILFDFNLHSDTFTYQDLADIKTVSLEVGYLRVNNGREIFEFTNGWTKANRESAQVVVRQYDVVSQFNFYKIDVYENSGALTDLVVNVFVNNVKKSFLDYTVYKQDSIAYVQFFNNLTVGDILVIETESSAKKTSTGYYKFPINLESNPQNLSLSEITLGEINNHVRSITDNFPTFTGATPGLSNLRDLGNVAPYGRRIVQHSAPLSPVIYHITNKKFNVIKAIRHARDEYSKFKRNFLRVATSFGYDGSTKDHLDLVLQKLTKEKSKTSPYFLSDMVPFGANFTFTQKVIDNAIVDYPLTFDFDLTSPSEKSVLVYLNSKLLTHKYDYKFVNNFVRLLTPIVAGDLLEIVQYSSTDGCCVPPTPTKLGLYPLFKPEIFIDTTYQTPTKVIQGHDGSITVAFNDFRDDLILDLETRIYNNIKVSYDPELFDIHNFVSGFYRNTGLSVTDLNNVLRQEFLRWTSFIKEDYTKHTFFDRNNPFTFNYNKFSDSKGNLLKGFWRGIFRDFYDTDRPHTHPWEMLGFCEEPAWWKELYGPAPYTKDNLILWTDLQDGVIKEPGKLPVRNPKYVRPNLLKNIPVNEVGELVSPLAANLVVDYVSTNVEHEFAFGDGSPIESAWRRSSDYAFSLITSLTLLRPAKVFSTGFDRIRQVRDPAGEIVYKTNNGNLRFNSKNLVTPNTVNDSSRVFTSGLVNYVVDYTISMSVNLVSEYRTDLDSLRINIASKIGGFTSKEKFKLILDSRTPLNEGNVFVPEENYNIILNTSSPVLSISYSGVIIEKHPGGFVVRGYNKSIPEFKYYKPLARTSDPVVNIGGISETFVDWSSDQYYSKGLIVRSNQVYYRVSTAHKSTSTFESKYFTKLPNLPVTGGRDIILRKQFDTAVSALHYGAELTSIQDVVDFLLGYGEYLSSSGFSFGFYNDVLKTVIDWQTSAREFAFWTTQNWSDNAVISLSPSADELIFQKDYAVVDNVYDNFYEYSIFKEDGAILEPNFTNSVRTGNSFTLRPKNTADGIYHVTLNLVQKEHVVVLDNVTVFNDVIYDQVQGYRQERIRVLGYKTANWQGDFNIPGFVYDNALVLEWKPWKDYALGETVKYKEFYYSAKTNVPGTEEFNATSWFKLNGRPSPRLLPNWDYRANQFFDFYDLDTNSFDVSQQKFAQHLIGYQKRQYLENIINDDVSQYKFYQGMIQEKGTKNSLSKLFDALNSADKDSLEFHEEWAIRLGQYGATAGFDEVEFLLDESKFFINPQPFELTSTINPTLNDFVQRLTPSQVYLAPENYSNNIFPVDSTLSEYVRTAGFVRPDDVNYIVKTKDEFLGFDASTLKNGDYFWVGFDNASWNVYRYSIFSVDTESVIVNGTVVRVTLPRLLDAAVQAGDYVGIYRLDSTITGVHKIVNTGTNYFDIEKPTEFFQEDADLINADNLLNLFKFSSQRSSNIDDLSSIYMPSKKPGELVWIDNSSLNNWKVWQFTNKFSFTTISSSTPYFGEDVSVADDDCTMAVSIPNKVTYYTRGDGNLPWAYEDTLTSKLVTGPYANTNNSFGKAIRLSKSGDQLFISAPLHSAKGYVALFTKNADGYFTFTRVFTPSTTLTGGQFGNEIVVSGSILIVSSKGTTTGVPGAISTFNVNTGALLDSYEYLTTQVNDVSVSDSGVLVVGREDEKADIFNVSSTGALTIAQTVTTADASSSFGKTVSISRDGVHVAVGSPTFNSSQNLSGKITIFKKGISGYTLAQTLLSPGDKEKEKFGFSMEFNISGDRLMVYSQVGDQIIPTTFDNNTTTFDNKTTRFVEAQSFVGTVRVFDNYNTKFIFVEELTVPDALGSSYGSQISVTNRVYINDPGVGSGAIYDFYSPSKTWTVVRESTPRVNTEKIKSVFLYDVKKSSVVTYLDFIDPISGKIIGIAEQELKYKVPYDPAIYSVGNDTVVVDALMNWERQIVGALWWDLSTVKFINPYQGSPVFKANSWNTVFPGATVDVYEWVESDYLPSEWDSLADTEEGLTLGISGISKYGDEAYSYTQRYDTVSKTFKNVYYFWVKNKSTVPDVDFRKISARDVAEYISDPKAKGIQYVTLLSNNQFALVNCKNLISDKNIAINFRYWIIENQNINIHSHYQLLAEGDVTKKLNKYVEQKWFDSLIGYDALQNEVPDPKLPAKLRYGILSSPRQGMFVNRLEALKQVVERVNSVLRSKLLIDDFDLSSLDTRDTPPSVVTGKFDIAVDLYEEIRFIGTANIRTAILSPVIENGKITRVIIVDSGKGYKVAPYIKINGIGSGAQLKSVINSKGEITSVTVEKEGVNYLSSTSLTVRPFTVLVNADETANGKWTLYTLNVTTKAWTREKTQTFDTTKYRSYINWYDNGYNEFTKIDHEFDFAYEIPVNDVQLGQVVKVNNEGAGGWILLEKIDDRSTLETTINYKIIGRQNGTIQFNSNLYQFANNNVGYDGPTFDNDLFDDQPKEELRIILNCIKNDLFVDDLEIEFNNLFFASLRYAFTEQPFIDWAFKTSFVKSKHNLGSLEQSPTFYTNNLSSYEDYINEVKPYRSKIREFISVFDRLESTNSFITDFDLSSRYDSTSNTIRPFNTKVYDYGIGYDSNDILNEPYRSWYDNAGYSVVSIEVVDGGSGYVSAPLVDIEGVSSEKSTATAYLSNGKVSKIIVNSIGSGYVRTPIVNFVGEVPKGATPARAVAILGNGLTRSLKVDVKFDRLSPKYTTSFITVTQQFTGSGSRTRFELTWPIDLNTNTISVTVNNEEKLKSEFTAFNEKDVSSSYTRYKGVVIFNNPTSTVPVGSTIVIKYQKDIGLLDAADRIQYYYNATSGKLGKDLGQLMAGVDYGGVEVTGIGFDLGAGWDALPWFVGGWDSYDPSYTDYIVKGDGYTRSFTLPSAPAVGEIINIYLNNVRIDDINYNAYNTVKAQYEANAQELANLAAEQVLLKDIEQEKFNELQIEQIALQSAQSERNAISLTLSQLVYGTPEYTAKEAELVAKQQEVDALLIAVNEKEAIRESALDNLNNKTSEVVAKQLEVNAAIESLNLAGTDTPIRNPNAIMNSFIGNGVTKVITLPESANFVGNQSPDDVYDIIIFRKDNSDGSFVPSASTYDTEVSGGNLAYSTALGVSASDINIDGDGFVTPVSSHAPEEVVPGHVVDTVDIKVYHKISDGAPIIINRHYIVTDVLEKSFNIGQRMSTKNSVFVTLRRFDVTAQQKVNKILEQGVDYSVNFLDQQVVIGFTLEMYDEINILSSSFNGADILDIATFVADGETDQFVTSARWRGDFTVFATIDGVSAGATTFVANTAGTSTFISEDTSQFGNIGVKFGSAPLQGSIVSCLVLSSAVDSISKIQNQTIVFDGVSSEYKLENTPAINEPLDANIIVTHLGKILNPADYVYINVSGNNRTYYIDSVKYPLNSLDPTVINVYLNNVLLGIGKEYSWSSSVNELKVKRGIAKSGDSIVIEITKGAQYKLSRMAGNVYITLVGNYNVNDELTVSTFTNHNILSIERGVNSVKTTTSVTYNTPEYYRFNEILGNRFKLGRYAVSSEYVWVSLNGELLSPEIDYILEDNKEYIRLDSNIKIVNDDVIDVIAFSNDIITNPFGYRIFKDMLNRVHYLRIDDTSSTTLSTPLSYYDKEIVVDDASNLATPSAELNQPGVIVIDGERIEYMKKENNTLGQLRRGTLGTGSGIRTFHSTENSNIVIKDSDAFIAGTKIRDFSNNQQIPYKDEIEETIAVVTSAKFTGLISGNILTVTDRGNGAVSIGQVITGNGILADTFILEQLTSTEVGNASGGRGTYRVTVNQSVESTVISAITKSIVLDYTPILSNVKSWYRNTIPVEYGQCDQLEVFVAGRRLRKAPLTQWNESLGPDSPIGDTVIEAEFAVNGTNTLVRLTETPTVGTKIQVQRKIGKLWTNIGESLKDADTAPARFIRAKSLNLPQ